MDFIKFINFCNLERFFTTVDNLRLFINTKKSEMSTFWDTNIFILSIHEPDMHTTTTINANVAWGSLLRAWQVKFLFAHRPLKQMDMPQFTFWRKMNWNSLLYYNNELVWIFFCNYNKWNEQINDVNSQFGNTLQPRLKHVRTFNVCFRWSRYMNLFLGTWSQCF